MAADDGALTGRVVGKHRIKGITLDGWVVWHERTLIDIGRPDPIGAVDPDAALQAEPPPAKTPNVVAMNAARAKRQAVLAVKIVAYLREQGPMTTLEIHRDLDIPYSTLKTHMAEHEGSIYRRWGKVRGAVVWDLLGD